MQTTTEKIPAPPSIAADYRKSTNTLRAIGKAKTNPCEVKPLGSRWYRVTTAEGHKYVVKFWLGEDGRRYGACDCVAGTEGRVKDSRSGETVRPVCYHAVWAAVADSWETGYPAPDAELLVRYAMKVKGADRWDSDEWANLRRRVMCPSVFYREQLERQGAAF